MNVKCELNEFIKEKKKLGKLSIDFLSKVNDLQVMLDGENGDQESNYWKTNKINHWTIVFFIKNNDWKVTIVYHTIEVPPKERLVKKLSKPTLFYTYQKPNSSPKEATNIIQEIDSGKWSST